MNCNHKSGWVWRVWVSIILIVSLYCLSHSYENAFRPAVDAKMAAQQLNGGTGTYAETQVVLHANHITFAGSVIILAILWIPWCSRSRYDHVGCECHHGEDGCHCQEPPQPREPLAPTTTLGLLLGVLVLSSFGTGCMGPARYDKFEEVGPNETAFVIPLQGDTKADQATFNSIGYLNERKVAAKRIPIPLVLRSTGRMWYDYEWIPAVAVFKVDRSLISREWVEDSNKGTRNKNEGIPVATKDSIQLTFGIAVTTFIEEEDAPTYLYYHGLQKLADVTDNNVRNFCVTELTRECGGLTLQELKDQAPAIFTRLYQDAKKYFKTKGITISQLGNAEGYQFTNEKIQEAINKRYIAEQDIETARQEKLAQDKRNEKTIAMAEAQAAAAKKLLEAAEATRLQNQLEISQMQAKAALTMAEKWNGQLPANILPANSPMLMALGANTATNSVSK